MEKIKNTLLTIEECVSLSGVQLETIKQYQELGLLRVLSIQGRDYFEEEDIRLIFNYKPKAKTVVTENKTSVSEDDELNELPTLSSILNLDTSNSTSVKEEKVIPFKARANPTLDLETNKIKDPSPVEDKTTETIKTPEVAPDIIGESDYNSSDYSNANFNNSTFSEDKTGLSSIDILDLTRSLKSQLEIVKSERDWLRTRVEKLELQIERQQAISMSESDTLKSLALLNLDQKKKLEERNSNRKSPFDFLLSWTKPKEY